MSEQSTWHGLNREQWMKLFESGGWRQAITRSLYEVIRSPDADFKDRLYALQTLNEAITSGYVAPDPRFPILLRNTLIELSLGMTKRSWFAGKRRRKKLHAQLAATRWMLGTIENFPDATAAAELQTEQREVDMTRCS
jgi:hypothetical protein